MCDEKMGSKFEVETSVFVVVKNRCQFCYAFFKETAANIEHSKRCSFRFSEKFQAADGNEKFACAVCFDVFDSRDDHEAHEQLHKLPGGFPCTYCHSIFLNEFVCAQHMETAHEILKCHRCTDDDPSPIDRVPCKHDSEDSRYAACQDCDAYFEQNTYLRLHVETNCGCHQNALGHVNFATVKCEPGVDILSVFDCGAVGTPANNGLDELLNEECAENDTSQMVMDLEAEDPIPIDNEMKIENDENEIEMDDENEVELNDNQYLFYDESAKERVYKCNLCNATYEMAKHFRRHYARHGPDGNLLMKCTNCGKFFANYVDMCEHRAVSHRKGHMSCEKCGLTCVSRFDLWQHEKSTHQDDFNDGDAGSTTEMTCDMCDELFLSDSAYRRHCEILHNRKSAKCHICGITFQNLQCHMRSHSQGSFECEHCPRVFFHQKVLDKHVTVQHSSLPKSDTGDEPQSSSTLELNTHRSTCTTVGDSKSDAPEREGTSLADAALNVQISTVECVLCKKTFESLSAFNKHNMEVHGYRLDPCPECGLFFEHLKLHIRRNHGIKKQYQCDYCDRIFSLRGGIVSHMFLHTGIYPYECDACGEGFLTKSELRAHRFSQADTCGNQRINYEKPDSNQTDAGGGESKAFRRHLPKYAALRERKFACELCQKKFATKNLLAKHIKVHGSDGRYIHKCTCCPKYFVSMDEMNAHKAVHLDRLKCTICNVTFAKPSGLYMHNRFKHTNTEKNSKTKSLNVCMKCGLTFSSKYYLKAHEDSDCGRLLLFKCDDCGKYLRTKHILTTHREGHKKKFACEYCGNSFGSKGSLSSHIRIHTSERPFKCDKCDKTFMHQGTLSCHESVHTGFKRYICRNCNDRFSCHSNLRAHRRVRKDTCGKTPMTDFLLKKQPS